jgi:hypothetical protein
LHFRSWAQAFVVFTKAFLFYESSHSGPGTDTQTHKATLHICARMGENEFFKFVNDLQHPGQNKNTNSDSSKSITTDYKTANEQFNIDNFNF